MLQSFMGEAMDDPCLEAKGTAGELLCRAEIEMLHRARALGVAHYASTRVASVVALDVDLHEQAAHRFEGAASHHREAARCYLSGDHERAHFHVCAAQALCTDLATIMARVGQSLWRSMKDRE